MHAAKPWKTVTNVVALVVTLTLPVACVVAQVATGIHLVNVNFTGDTRLSGVDLSRCAADLKSQIHEGPEWQSELADYVQHTCLQDEGYFKAHVTSSAKQLPDRNGTHQFIAMFHINAGPLYRAGEIRFTGNHEFSSTNLQDMFDFRPGDIYRLSLIRNGISRMKMAYAERGYPKFTPIPDFTIDESNHVITAKIDIYEGTHAN